VGEHEGGPVHLGQDGGHGEGLAAARHAEQDLVPVPAAEAFRQLRPRGGLVAARLELADQLETAVGGGGSEALLRRAHGAHVRTSSDRSASPLFYDLAVFGASATV